MSKIRIDRVMSKVGDKPVILEGYSSGFLAMEDGSVYFSPLGRQGGRKKRTEVRPGHIVHVPKETGIGYNRYMLE